MSSNATVAALLVVVTLITSAVSLYRHGLGDLLSGLAILAFVGCCFAYRTAARPARRATAPGPPSDDRAWIQLVEEDVELIDELDRHRSRLDDSGRALADHVTSRLQEALERSGVEVIEGDVRYDRMRHAAVQSDRPSLQGAAIAEVVSPGFAIGRQVVRRARVRLGS
jgi:GrpE